MTRGQKKHMKRLYAPSSWMLGKLDGVFARSSIPLAVILRHKLKYSLTRRETMMICMQKLVEVDGRVRTDINFPVGFMDVVRIERSGDLMRILYDTKGRFVLHKVEPEEGSFKLCKVKRQELTKKATPYIVTHDGRTVRYPDPDIKVDDTVKIDLATGKVVDFVKYAVGTTVFVTQGRSTGRVGTILHLERHPGSFDIVTVRDAEGNTFATRKGNTFLIGKTDKKEDLLISLPRGDGIKRTIFENRESLLKKKARV
eukprot:CAMPEP_0117035870 /NCGR_PEP_ID=MMETSP0472-20121206/25451_1 /TAXON_ID=693140 ORGANISM="Tiarina fusus, Strain LIS" /NCGR_SAMPLE_ID=MMETSP0472 /ASSEMBLY_ACC=CAM_ASM_000603 /LENGTH=255 /DNA_ID=CAMNT_0004745473 /DNA_START=17 /DNA_END=784 /DNA_ORIENTATION=+